MKPLQVFVFFFSTQRQTGLSLLTQEMFVSGSLHLRVGPSATLINAVNGSGCGCLRWNVHIMQHHLLVDSPISNCHNAASICARTPVHWQTSHYSVINIWHGLFLIYFF